MARVGWLDHLKGLGILFIVLGHIVGAGYHLSQNLTQDFCEGAYKYFNAFHIPLFFVVAGMTFKRQPWQEFFKKRFFRLLVPYFVFGVIAAVIYSLTDSVSTEILNASDTTGYYQGKTAGITFGQQLLNLVLGGWYTYGFVGNSVLWFIPALFMVEVFTQGIAQEVDYFAGSPRHLRCLAMTKVVWVSVICLSLSIYWWVKLPQLPWALGMVPKYLPYLIVGYFMGLRAIPLSRKYLLPLSLIAIIVFGWLTVQNPYLWRERIVWQHLISMGIILGNILAWWGFAQCISLRLLAQCGIWSLGIMLMHKYPMLLIQNYFTPVRNLFTGDLCWMLLGILIVFIFSNSLCWVACWIIQLKIPWLLGTKKAVFVK